MDCNRNFDSFPDTSLVLLSFLKQKGCQNSVLKRELDDLDEQLKLPTNHNYIESEGELQTDGHNVSFSYREFLLELQHQVQPQVPGILDTDKKNKYDNFACLIISYIKSTIFLPLSVSVNAANVSFRLSQC